MMTRSGSILFIATIAIALMIAGCDDEAADDRSKGTVSDRAIEDVLAEDTPRWMSMPGVLGTAIGESEGRPCIRILVAERTTEMGRAIPTEVDGYTVEITETGQIKALEDSTD